MAKLNQIIAIEKGIKSRANSTLSDLYKAIQKPDLFNGMKKEYQKVDEDGEDLPSERKVVQFTVPDSIDLLKGTLADLIDITARKDISNCSAKADVKVNGKVVVKDAPVPFLLFLEKQLTDIKTFIAHLPTLDSTEVWNLDENSGLYASETIKTHRTKKVQKPIVLYDATPNHPAQTELITEDELAGHWKLNKFSGAVPEPVKRKMLERTIDLLNAVKQAREEANGTDETPSGKVADNVFDFIFND